MIRKEPADLLQSAGFFYLTNLITTATTFFCEIKLYSVQICAI